MTVDYAIYNPTNGDIVARVGSTQSPEVFMQSYPGMSFIENTARIEFNDETHHVVYGKITPL